MVNDVSVLNPHLKILVQAQPLAPEIEADLISVLVSQDLEAPSMFELQLKLEIRGWIPGEKKEVTGKAEVGKEGGIMGGSTSKHKQLKQLLVSLIIG